MVLSRSSNYSNNKTNYWELGNQEVKIKALKQNGQIQIYQSPYRGSFSSIVSDSIRNAALGRKVLLVQLMKGGVKQGLSNPQKLCGNLTWIRSSDSYDQYNSEEVVNNENIAKSINQSINELWSFCKNELLSGNYYQIILDEIFLAFQRGIVYQNDLISTLENRYISGDVILTGTSVPKSFLLMADQITELRS